MKDPAFKQQWSKQKKGEILYRLCVPQSKNPRTNVTMEFHDGATSTHPGSRRTYPKVAQWYYWQTMDQDIRKYVRTCETCVRWKSSSQKKYDFITGLLASEGYDAIFIVVDKLSKRPKYPPTYTTADAKDSANIFWKLLSGHGVPKVIISDRDSKFLSDLWWSLTLLMGVKLSMTTAH
ncbi:hypothetical protein PHMEG_00032724 [Phytophthora megakarya]|uniref:Integrase catalytic domain-containing protein n=1 Tax=Phytophthora megakarya TaxID=4795 RepID=A0A225UV97_9STRA|nr:hypothetical protein PHMEG_00032724 [Phytophthora megakarya]